MFCEQTISYEPTEINSEHLRVLIECFLLEVPLTQIIDDQNIQTN